MKKLLLVVLAAIPLFASGVNFIYDDYDEDCEGGYWCDEYWYPAYYGDEHWVYYPHGYYCVHYVWYHPWYWDWYWWHCYWCHHWDWHFYGAGFYVVWYEDGGWWWRPRYGRWVRYRMPYAYRELRQRAHEYGYSLPEKPPREIDIPYQEKEVLRLTKEKDPTLYARLEKEKASGNLEKYRQDYERKTNEEIRVKNEEYRKAAAERDKEVQKRDGIVREKTVGRADDARKVEKTRDDADHGAVTRKPRTAVREEAVDNGGVTKKPRTVIRQDEIDEDDSDNDERRAPDRSRVAPERGRGTTVKRDAALERSKEDKPGTVKPKTYLPDPFREDEERDDNSREKANNAGKSSTRR